MEKQPLNEECTLPPMEMENRVPRKMRLSLGNGRFPLPSPIEDGDFTASHGLFAKQKRPPKTTLPLDLP